MMLVCVILWGMMTSSMSNELNPKGRYFKTFENASHVSLQLYDPESTYATNLSTLHDYVNDQTIPKVPPVIISIFQNTSFRQSHPIKLFRETERFEINIERWLMTLPSLLPKDPNFNGSIDLLMSNLEEYTLRMRNDIDYSPGIGYPAWSIAIHFITFLKVSVCRDNFRCPKYPYENVDYPIDKSYYDVENYNQRKTLLHAKTDSGIIQQCKTTVHLMMLYQPQWTISVQLLQDFILCANYTQGAAREGSAGINTTKEAATQSTNVTKIDFNGNQTIPHAKGHCSMDELFASMNPLDDCSIDSSVLSTLNFLFLPIIPHLFLPLIVVGIPKPVPVLPNLPNRSPSSKDTMKREKEDSDKRKKEQFKTTPKKRTRTTEATTKGSSSSTKKTTTVSTTKSSSTTTQKTTTVRSTTTTQENQVCFKESSPQYLNSTYRNGTTRRPGTGKRSRRSFEHILPHHQYPVSPFGRCYLKINEIDSNYPGFDIHEFIELIKSCLKNGRLQQKKPMRGWLLLIMRGFPAEIIFIADLSESHMKKFINNKHELLWVLGDRNIPEVDMNFESPKIQRIKLPDAEGNIPNGRRIPNAVILIHLTSSKVRDKFRLPRRDEAGQLNYLPLPVTDALERDIKNNVQDCVLYGEKLHYESCATFERVCSKILRDPKTDYVLRDFEVAEGGRDFSISRCATHPYPFDPYAYKHTDPSPGKKNLCENGVSIIVAERILDLAPLVGQNDMVPIAVVEQQPLCENRGVNNMQMELVDDNKYRELLDAEREKLIRECWPNDNPNTRYYHLLTGLESLKTFVEDRTTPEEPGWKAPMPNDHISNIEVYMSDLVDVDLLRNPVTGAGLERLARANDKASIRCGICYRFTKGNNRVERVTSTLITQLMTEEGMLHEGPNAKKINNRNIIAHAKNQVHIDAINYLEEEFAGKKFRKHLEEAIMEHLPPRDRYYIPTDNVFRLAVEHVNHNVAFRLWPDKMKNMKNIQGNVGYVYHSARGLKKIISSISEDIHKKVVDEILRGLPMAIMIDGYQSQHTGIHYLSIAFQMFYLDTPKTVYVKTVKMGTDLSAKGHIAAIKQVINQQPEAVRKAFKDNTVAFGAGDTDT
jgi:hypothetical protein